MKFRILGIAITVLACVEATGQSGYTPVTATLNACYANGSVQASWINQSSAPTLPLLDGSVFAQQVPSNMDSSAQFTLSLADTSQINVSPSQWKITACSKGGSQPLCYTVMATVLSTPLDLTSAFSGAPIPSGCTTGSGTVTRFSSGNLTALSGAQTIFTTSVTNPTTTPSQTFTLATQNADTFFGGPCGGSAAFPSFRLLCAIDYPVFGASGPSTHGQGAVPDPGATAGTSRFLREDATWATPPGGTSGCTALTFSGTPTFTFTTPCVTMTMTANITASAASGYSQGTLYTVVLTQDATGGRTYVPPAVFIGGPTEINRTANGKTFCKYLAFPGGNLYLQDPCTWF